MSKKSNFSKPLPDGDDVPTAVTATEPANPEEKSQVSKANIDTKIVTILIVVASVLIFTFVVTWIVLATQSDDDPLVPLPPARSNITSKNITNIISKNLTRLWKIKLAL